MSTASELIRRANEGDREASAALLPLIYDQLRELARHKLRHERDGHSLQATALVHEAYLRLTGSDGSSKAWDDQYHFFGAAAEAMRRVLVDHARSKKRLKRGGGQQRVELEQVEEEFAQWEVPDNILELDEALQKLALHDPTAAELVQLRYFAGLSNRQAAESLGISPRTADRLWAYARAWLLEEMRAG